MLKIVPSFVMTSALKRPRDKTPTTPDSTLSRYIPCEDALLEMAKRLNYERVLTAKEFLDQDMFMSSSSSCIPTAAIFDSQQDELVESSMNMDDTLHNFLDESLAHDQQELMEENHPKKRNLGQELFVERMKRRSTRQFSTVKTGFRNFCRGQKADNSMYALIGHLVYTCSSLTAEISLFTSFRIMRLLNLDPKARLPIMDNTFFHRCATVIANQMEGLKVGQKLTNDPDIDRSIMDFRVHMQPRKYIQLERPKCMKGVLKYMASQARVNFLVSVQ